MMTRGELAEWLFMIGVIISWWPLIFLGWSPLAYRIGLYSGSAIILGIILVRRIMRVHEGLMYSRRIIQQQHALRFGTRPPLTVHGPARPPVGKKDASSPAKDDKGASQS